MSSTTVAARRSIVIHAHFYQPPREEPWLELVERETGAAPYHDWNQRIEQECYRTVIAARIPGPEGRIAKIVNTLDAISYDVGPTLLEWMETEAPATYAEFVAADRRSRSRHHGHGNAMAMPYHHVILPLASRRDKVTEVRWGLADFRRRFGREPEGMWLPETAVDEETLEVLAQEGIAFTILAPHQVETPPPNGLPGLYRTSAGRSIALFLYDGPVSHDVAFGPLVRDAAAWTARLLEPPLPHSGSLLRAVATDGETFGHHHRFGEMALAAALERLRETPGVQVTNFGAFLARHHARHEVKLLAPSSWSCPHGVERWRSDCRCRMKQDPPTSQAWRAPLRGALEWLAGGLHRRFETGAEEAGCWGDPWEARDAYLQAGPPADLPPRCRELLELERNALRMFTSCGWFFDDVGGIETIQVLRYAARAIDLAGDADGGLEAGLLERLAAARSNDPTLGTAAHLYQRARPGHSAAERAAAGFAAVSALRPDQARQQIGAYLVRPGPEGALEVRHRRTCRVDRLVATMRRRDALRVEVEVSEERGVRSSSSLGLDALPERERTLVREALRHEVLREVLTPVQLARLADGSARYPEAVAEALVELLPACPSAAEAVDVARLALALDLLTLEERHIPFDAQTRFDRLMTEAPARTREILRPLAVRFGFAATAFGEPGPG